MNIVKTDIDGLVVIQPEVFNDRRGYLFESFSEKKFAEKLFPIDFVQENESKSKYGVLRGLHYQLPPFSQSKLVRTVYGRTLDVAVDLRKGSPTFGRHFSVELTGENLLQVFIPRGFAHGFVVLSQEAVLQYKCDNYYSPAHEGAVAYDDPQLDIDWLLPPSDIILSDKDRFRPLLSEAALFEYRDDLYK